MPTYNDLFGGESAPPPRARRIVTHQPVHRALVLFETIGSAEEHPDERGSMGTHPVGSDERREMREMGIPSPAHDRPGRAPHVRGSATSEAAADAITPKLVGKRLVVLREVCEHFTGDGFTDNELIQHMVKAHGWNGNTPRARRIELVSGGWIESTDTTRNKSTVWMPTEAAREWYRQEKLG